MSAWLFYVCLANKVVPWSEGRGEGNQFSSLAVPLMGPVCVWGLDYQIVKNLTSHRFYSSAAYTNPTYEKQREVLVVALFIWRKKYWVFVIIRDIVFQSPKNDDVDTEPTKFKALKNCSEKFRRSWGDWKEDLGFAPSSLVSSWQWLRWWRRRRRW